jgi:DUF1009 family protein
VPQVLGLIAGEGELPLEIARAACDRGHAIHAVGFHGLTSARLAGVVHELEWFHLGEVEALLASLHRAGVRDAVMAGKVDKSHLFRPLEALRPDARALALLASLPDRNDDSILGALAGLLEEEGIVLRPQAELVPQLLAEAGCLGKIRPTNQQLEDAMFGWPIAKQVAASEIGQCVVVKQGAVLAVEAIEGTDAAVARAAALGGGGVCVVKVARPGQDPRFDLPAIGPRTLEGLVSARAGMLVVEAGATLVLGRERTLQLADEADIALLGMSADEGPVNEDAEEGR